MGVDFRICPTSCLILVQFLSNYRPFVSRPWSVTGFVWPTGTLQHTSTGRLWPSFGPTLALPVGQLAVNAGLGRLTRPHFRGSLSDASHQRPPAPAVAYPEMPPSNSARL